MAKENSYDSLDELDGTIIIGEPKLNSTTSATTLHYDIASIVPLYGRETLKYYIKPSKKSICKPKSKIPIPNFTRNSSDAKIMRAKYKKPSPSIKDVVTYNKGEKSYTTIFYTRIGHPSGQTKKPEVSDTVRAQCGDCTHRTDDSNISATTYYSDAQSYVSDSTSFYFKLIEENKAEQKVTSSKTTSNLSSNIDMPSISEYSVNNPEAGKKKNATKKIVSLIVPVLGGLGPDIASNQEKLNRLRKQISYGQKASTQNRIKMMEVKVLKDLKKEMKNSNCMDRSVSNLIT